MALIIHTVTAQDFLSYREPQSVTLSGQGPLAVIGKNGAGKSTLVSKAIAWGLYGTCSPERMGTSTRALKGKDVLRRGKPKASAAIVTIELHDTDTTEAFIVTRTRKRTGADKITITGGGSGWGATQTQADVDRLIGASYEVFVRTCLRGQNDPWNFAEATDMRKREILDAISGAELLGIPYERAKQIATTKKVEASSLLRRADDAKRRSDTVDPWDLGVKASGWKTAQASKIATAKAEANALESAVNTARKHDADQAAIHASREAHVTARPDRLDHKPYIDATTGALGVAMKARYALESAQLVNAEKQALIAAGLCATCGQAIAGDAHIRTLTDLTPFQTAVDKAERAHAEAERIGNEAIKWDLDTQAHWQKQMDALPVAAKDRAPAAESQWQSAKDRAETISNAQNPWTEAEKRAWEQFRELKREAAVLLEAHDIADREARLAGAWQAVLAPKGVRAHLAEGALSAIESEANRWLAVLSDGRMSVSFPATRETKRAGVKEEIQTIVMMDGEVQPLLAYSGGEKRRINLAVDLGVASTFARGGALALSLLVLDEEVFSGMDEAGKAGVVTALHHAGVADVVVIDHDPALHGTLPRTVMVSRGTDGYSMVEELA